MFSTRSHLLFDLLGSVSCFKISIPSTFFSFFALTRRSESEVEIHIGGVMEAREQAHIAVKKAFRARQQVTSGLKNRHDAVLEQLSKFLGVSDEHCFQISKRLKLDDGDPESQVRQIEEEAYEILRPVLSARAAVKNLPHLMYFELRDLFGKTSNPDAERVQDAAGSAKKPSWLVVPSKKPRSLRKRRFQKVEDADVNAERKSSDVEWTPETALNL